MSRSIAFVLLSAVTAVIAAWSLYLPYRPQVVTSEAPADVFSAGRAEAHLEAIAARPHPVGSAAAKEVMRYLVAQLDALGLEVAVHSTPFLGRLNRRNIGVHVENVVARLPGREPGPAALFVAHYDSVPHGPGAADDAAAVAALLEMLRAVQAGPQLENDLIVLFSDAEELGLLGAQAFHDLHPWMEDVRVVANFEARGYRGPVIMFETGDGNARWVRELRAAGAPVVAASFSDEIYTRMPNDTDFTVFKGSHRAGLNFAFIHDALRYHTALDNLDQLDRRSLQQHGEIALALARRLGEVDLEAPPSGDAIYFNLFGALVIFPMAVGLALCAVAVAAALWLLFRALRGGLRAGRVAAATLSLLLAAVASAALLLLLTRALAPDHNFARGGGMSTFQLVQLGQTLAAVGLCALLYRLLRRFFEVAHLVAGGLVLWLLKTALTGFAVPGASYLFTLPLIAALPAAAWALRREPGETGPVAGPVLAALALATVLGAHLWTTPLALGGVALGPATSALATGFAVAFATLGLWAPIWSLSDGGRLAWGMGGAGAVLGITALVLAPGSFSELDRRPSSLLYVLDQESDVAHWYSLLPLNPWTRSYLGESPEEARLPPYLGRPGNSRRAPAPVAPFEPPRVRLLGVSAAAGAPAATARTWDLEVVWPSYVPWFHVFVEPRDQVRAVALGEQRREILGSGGLPPFVPTLSWFAPPPEGVRFSLEMHGDAPLELELVGLRWELPEIPGFNGEPMPPDRMTARFSWLNTAAAVRNVVRLGADDVAEPEAEVEMSASEALPAENR